MKNKKFIFGIIVGVLFTSTITYATYKYQAREVGYTPENSEFKVDNVEDAVNELYKNYIPKTKCDDFTIPRDGLIAEWLFNDGTYNDTSGNGNHLNATNTVSFGTRGNEKTAILNNSKLTRDASFLPKRNEPFTISYWVNVKSISYGVTIISMNGNSGARLLAYDGGSNYFIHFRPLVGGNPSDTYPEVNISPKIGEWMHLVFTWTGDADNPMLKIYADGEEKFVYTKDNYISNTSSWGDFQIGFTTGYNYWFDGQIDNIRIYNRVLTPTEVKKIYYYDR